MVIVVTGRRPWRLVVMVVVLDGGGPGATTVAGQLKGV